MTTGRGAGRSAGRSAGPSAVRSADGPGIPGVTEPENRPIPVGALTEEVTSAGVHYRRNHHPYPCFDASAWRLRVTGAVQRDLDLHPDDLSGLPSRELVVLLECAGHRRTEFSPPIAGVQWGFGALSQAQWGGVALADVLALAGPRDGAAEIVLHGADKGTFAQLPGTHTFSRSLPVAKAMDPDTLLATSMNGAALPHEHGAPLRAIVPGWYAMDSVKWITSIEVVTEPFRGAYQELDYRLQPEGCTGIGERIAEMPVHALFSSIADGDRLPVGRNTVTGFAWGGGGVDAVEVCDGTGSWVPAAVQASGPYERSVWTAEVEVPPGQHALAVRATDTSGRTQPDAPVWNRRGYVNNSVHRVTVVAA